MSTTRKRTVRFNPSRKGRTTTDAVQILDHMVRDDPKTRALVERATVNALVAKLIYEARAKAGLSQRQLAGLIGTKQPVIARLEDSEYDGHSLTMLQRIATALNQSLQIRFTPNPRELRRAG